ncbi:hypothetical protein BCL76_101783 [Streptomyces sp. CG 926]|uniref:hypothetical protein n=1 Tax=Streptomyces sp. CG 926 TaxID=1882405 RepID=UPI000D6BBD9D|nr:hypothetical protein [Streptomyces sp. CG 926]PWK75048.1 hypothetical protein BCL76_101783 [Streptomyces sp. CG 926]
MERLDDGAGERKSPQPAAPCPPHRRQRFNRLVRRLLLQSLLGAAGAAGATLITWLLAWLQSL